MIIIHLLVTLFASTVMYYKLHKITHMNKRLFFIDNIIVGLFAWLIGLLLIKMPILALALSIISLPIIAYLGIQIRFWRSPNRRLTAKSNEVVSPADGNVIYINKIEENDDFVSIKNGRLSELHEFTQTDLIKKPCWHIGINMTPFDVHKNCSPIDGKIIQSKHVPGEFHSLKEFISLTENERHTYVIANDDYSVGVVQIASRRVRRIDSYVKEGQNISKGEWIGMIRFGSQVDLFLPIDSNMKIKLKDQVYAKKTIVAEIK